MGELAWALLGEGAEASVLGRTSRALFLEVGGEVLWVEGPAGPLHRRGVVAEAVPAWEAGGIVTVSAGRVGRRPELRLDPAWIWRSPPPPSPPVDLGRRAHGLLVELQRDLEPLREAGDGGWAEGLADAAREGAGIAEWGRTWIGSGPGLTPLGDDLVGGALFALWVLGEGAGQGEELVGWARGRTTRLSGCLLADLSQGHGPAPLHRLAGALSTGQGAAARRAAQELVGVGHSTGRALLGAALVVWSVRKGRA
ncbi:MAG: DUF2877 domain-containing protein [Candidatus Acetothermia bacterium]|jgi:hypothetical protein|nr:DUF2877 domain-containing protein [Candidatus Acetothermia bacterium]